MENVWDRLKNASLLIQKWKISEAKIVYEEIYNLLDKEKIINWTEPIENFTSCMLWLWEIAMKGNDFKKSLEYYIEWNELVWWKDFNILFNLWVVYSNLNDKENSTKYLELAKKIEPNNPNLIRFLWQFSNYWWWDDNGNWKIEVNKSFKDKVQEMMKRINS